jgi:hypothetical protein
VWMSFPRSACPRARGSRADRTCGRIRCSRRWDACFGPHPRPRSRTQERGDSGERLWPLIAVLGYCEQLFGPPLNARGEGRESTSVDPGYPLEFTPAQPPRTRGLGRVCHAEIRMRLSLRFPNLSTC